MSEAPSAFACDLGALTVEERDGRSALASRIASHFREVVEVADGYAARLDADPVMLRDALDWLLLERRCCPFLKLDLCLEAANGPVWLQFRGGPGVKQFLAASGLNVSR